MKEKYFQQPESLIRDLIIDSAIGGEGHKIKFDLEIVGQGATTKVYRDGYIALKVYIDAYHFDVEREYSRQLFAYEAGLPVPEVYCVRRLDDMTTVLEMEYIKGQHLMYPGMGNEEISSAILTLVKLQNEVHKIKAKGEPKQRERFRAKIKNSPYLTKPLKEKINLLLIEVHNKRDSLCHGDFHPLNVIYDGNKHWIIDWVDATSGNPLADACRSYIIFKQFINQAAEAYLSTFCNEANVEKDDVLKWLPIVAVVRLEENIDEETRDWLMNIINEWDQIKTPASVQPYADS